MLELQSKDKTISFKVDSTVFTKALSLVDGVIAASTNKNITYYVYTEKSELYIVAFNQDNYVYLKVQNARSNGQGMLSFQTTDILKGILKGRGILEFSFTKKECEFKSVKGKYKGKFTTIPINVDDIALLKSKFQQASLEFSDKIQAILDEGINLTKVKNAYAETETTPVCIESNSKVITISSYDNYHFAMYSKNLERKLEFKTTLLSRQFELIHNLSGGDSFKLSISSNVFANNKDFAVVLPALQGEQSRYEMIPYFLQKLETDKPIFSCAFDIDRVVSIVENLLTFNRINAKLNLQFKDETLLINFSTDFGSASDALKLDKVKGKKCNIVVDPVIFKDSLSLVKNAKSLTMKIYEKVIIFDCKTKLGATLVVANPREDI
jgi:hypothetical protein